MPATFTHRRADVFVPLQRELDRQPAAITF
jgi:hypothetical protein